jgi:hypothetical protein
VTFVATAVATAVSACGDRTGLDAPPRETGDTGLADGASPSPMSACARIAFGPPMQLSADDQVTGEPDVASGPESTGTFAVVYRAQPRASPEPVFYDDAFVVDVDVQGAMGSPQRVSARSDMSGYKFGLAPAIAFGGNPQSQPVFLIAWSAVENSGDTEAHAYVAKREGGAVTTVVALSDHAALPPPRVGVAYGGEVAAVWRPGTSSTAPASAEFSSLGIAAGALAPRVDTKLPSDTAGVQPTAPVSALRRGSPSGDWLWPYLALDAMGNPRELRVRRLSPAGKAVGTAGTIARAGTTFLGASPAPNARLDGDGMVVAWIEDSRVRVAITDATPALTAGPSDVASGVQHAGAQVSIATDRRGYWIAWNDERPGGGPLHVAYLRPDLTVAAGPADLVVSGEHPDFPAIATNLGSDDPTTVTLLAWTSWDAQKVRASVVRCEP